VPAILTCGRGAKIIKSNQRYSEINSKVESPVRVEIRNWGSRCKAMENQP